MTKKLPLISNIQRFSVDDGPGIRTTVFFKGCNLQCPWCHNPECISPVYSLEFLENACKNCGRCTQVCPADVHKIYKGIHTIARKLCTGCKECAYHCPASAVTIIGKTYTTEELLKELAKDKAYFASSGGGVTFSGGEPMLHPEYLREILQLAQRQGFHTAVDTAGNVPFDYYEMILPYTDLFLYDIKFWDEGLHLAATGVSNRRILENLRKLNDVGKKIYIRIPVIMEWNGKLSEMEHIADFLASLPHPVDLIQLLPYHSYGLGKYQALGLQNHLSDHTPPTDDFMAAALHLYLERGLPARIS